MDTRGIPESENVEGPDSMGVLKRFYENYKGAVNQSLRGYGRLITTPRAIEPYNTDIEESVKRDQETTRQEDLKDAMKRLERFGKELPVLYEPGNPPIKKRRK